jgi:membrane protease subunit HflK
VLGSTSKVLVDQKGSNSLLYLPLDQLLRQAQAGPATSATTSDARVTAPPDATVTMDPTRARELPRSRERGDGR